MPKGKSKNGFTMIELLAVLVILGIIMAITIPTISYFLRGNSKDYYDKLEKTVATSGQDFFNDYRVNLPKDIGHVKKITVQTLQSQKYVTEIKGIDKKTCDGDVVAQKLTNGNYSYTACLKCEKKSDGTYGYVSDTKECGYSEENNNKYTILIDGLGDKTSIRIPQAQAYTVPNAKVYVNGQPLATSLKPMPGVVDVNVLTTYNVYYTFRTLVKQLEIKIYDPKKPVLANITATSGGTNYTSNTYSSKDVRVNLSGTDWTTSSVYGSGIDHILYQVNGESPRKIIPVTSDNRTYTTSFDFSANGTYNISAKAVDKEGNISDSKTFVVKIDKTTPTAPVITGGSTSWISTKRTISVSRDATSLSGIKNYQYYISTSSTTQSGGSWTNLSSGVKQVDITTEGTRYIFFRAVSNSGIPGLVSNSQTTRIDKSKPTAPVITGGSTSWISTKRTISVSRDATAASGIKNYQYYISTSSTTQSGGSWTNLSSGVKQVDITTSGTRYIFFRAVSNTGVIGLVSNNQPTRIDKTTPSAPTITGGSTTWINTKRTISVSKDATVQSGIKNYQYYISTSSTSQSGGSWTNLSSGVKQVDITIEGSRYIFFRAVSNTGAVGAVSNVQATKIDKTKPVITGVDGAGKWITTRTRVQITATDSLSGISAYSYDNGATWKANNYSTFSASTTMKLAVKDVAGNITYGSYSIKVDKNPPDIKWSTSDKWSNTSSYIKVETSDSESGVNRVEYQLDNCYSSKPGTLVTGSTFTTSSYTNCLKAYDNAGNVRSILVYAKIDKDAPYTPYISDSAKQDTLNNGYISFECSKNEMYSYGNNKCVLTKNHSSSNLTFWISHLDKGNSGIGYKEVSYLTNGVVVSNWKRYGINEIDAGYTHNSPCNKAGQCSKRIRYIDNAGNVGPGYLEIDFVDVY